VIDEDYKVVATDTLIAPKTDSLEIINEYIEKDEIE